MIGKIIHLNAKDESKARVMLDFNTESGRAFYVRFYDKAVEDELVNTIGDLMEREPTLEMNLENGTYCVRDPRKFDGRSEQTAWDLLMHRCWALSNEIRRDGDTGEKYHPVRFSDKFIEPCGKAFAV